jgi:hypothetical protein
VIETKLSNSFPVALKQDVEKVLEIITFGKDISIADNFITVNHNKEVIHLPYRIYFDEPSLEKEKTLTELQSTILQCIFLRHHNGFVRQRRLELLIDTTDYFIVTFIFQLLGEYVMEILEVLDNHINEKNIGHYIRFIQENPKFWQLTESRMISYWNVYYRQPRYPDYLPPKYATQEEYIGQKIIDRLKNAK